MSHSSLLSRIGAVLARPGAAVVVAFVIRAGWQYTLHAHPPYPVIEMQPYGYETGRLAASLALGHGFSSPLHVSTGPSAWMCPLYPLLLAGIFRITGVLSWASFLYIGMMNCALSAFTVWPIAALARKAFGMGTGITAGWMWAFLPTAVYYPVAWVWDTCLVALLFTLVLVASMSLPHSARGAAWGGYGILLGITALVNAAVVSTYPFLLGWAALRARQRARNWWRLAVVTSAAFILVLSPWWIRNYLTFHRFIPFRSNLGLEFWLGNNPRNPDIWAWWLHPDSDEGVMQEFSRLGELKFMETKQAEALDWIRAHPGDFLRDTSDRVMDNWLGYDEPFWQVFRMHRGMMILYLLSLVYAVTTFGGLLLAARRQNAYLALFTAPLLVFPLIYYVTHSSLRYRYPIEPVMCALSAYSFAALAAALWGPGTARDHTREPQEAGEMSTAA